MLQAINIEGLSLDKFLEHQVANSGWILEKGHGRGQLIVLPRNEFNHPELKKNAADSVPFEHITRIFPILGWPFCQRPSLSFLLHVLWGSFGILRVVPVPSSCRLCCWDATLWRTALDTFLLYFWVYVEKLIYAARLKQLLIRLRSLEKIYFFPRHFCMHKKWYLTHLSWMVDWSIYLPIETSGSGTQVACADNIWG